ncbi:MAG TPA: SMP-30/gluconolactonase/LRE family protein [Steroidobacteraceae bacterium]|nr:SMP-30/gluconolactonase/LRE family protein [Steroidobacteraceae bacterium]
MCSRVWLMCVLLILGLCRGGIACAEVDVIDPHAHYPEGPLWDQGRLLYVEYAAGDIKAWDGKGARIWWRREHCGPNGLIHFHGDHIVVACYDGNYLVELDAGGKTVRTISKDSSGKPFVGPNDVCSDGHGGIYFSASGRYDIKAPITGAVLHMSADGRDIREVANTIDYSNGLILSHDGRHLLVAEMLAGRILSFPVGTDGTLGPRVVWARLQDFAPATPGEDAYNGPDGIKLGPDGNYYIAQNGSGRVLVVNEDKKLVRIISVATRYVTNVGFGPPGTGAVYITGAFDQWKAPFPGAVYRWTP